MIPNKNILVKDVTSILPPAIFAQPLILSACTPLAPNSLPLAHALFLRMAHISGTPSHFLSVLNPLSLPSSLPSRPTSIRTFNTLFPCLYQCRSLPAFLCTNGVSGCFCMCLSRTCVCGMCVNPPCDASVCAGCVLGVVDCL